MAERNKLLEQLFDETVHSLLTKIRSGEAAASDLNVARQMLKDNGIEAIPTPRNPLGSLAKELPVFSDEETEKYSLN